MLTLTKTKLRIRGEVKQHPRRGGRSSGSRDVPIGSNPTAG